LPFCLRAFAPLREIKITSPDSRVTPAMESGIANHVWSIEEVVNLINQDSN
jgi:hypothetical protein